MTSNIPSTERDGSAGTILRSFLCGVVTGAALGILFSPMRGRDVRERLAVKARQGRNQVKGQKERLRALAGRTRNHVGVQARHVSRAVAEGRTALADIREHGEQALESIGSEAIGAMRDARTDYDEARTGIAES